MQIKFLRDYVASLIYHIGEEEYRFFEEGVSIVGDVDTAWRIVDGHMKVDRDNYSIITDEYEFTVPREIVQCTN